ncbi:DUF4186 family protein [Planotetraspora sp. A-T 1434]|uniref:DUF4186 family protein n=1 Tax=Planotetraspora sp. A-T 1434 TaxID=2979219 RepID=UPI003965C4D5
MKICCSRSPPSWNRLCPGSTGLPKSSLESTDRDGFAGPLCSKGRALHSRRPARTATCCRTCLQRRHDIPKGRELTPEEWAYAVDVICRWIKREIESPAGWRASSRISRARTVVQVAWPQAIRSRM